MADKLSTSNTVDAAAVAELANQVITLTKRATIMEAQVEVLDGKRMSLARFRDTLGSYVAAAAGVGVDAAAEAGAEVEADESTAPAEPDVAVTSRLLLAAQEDLRREIARRMHDGPAQSLTNIVLQAQIVERMVGGDPDAARAEVRQLIEMVEHTLEATKSFIFDVRPMVLDDHGLVPTLRRAARDRGRRAGVTVEFESLGADRRLAGDIESGLFRILDEALAGYLAGGPERIEMHIDWDEGVWAEVAAFKAVTAAAGEAAASGGRGSRRGKDEKEKKRDLPPALAAMVEEQKASELVAAEAARVAALITLPPATWRQIQARAATLDLAVELLDEGSRLRVVA